MSYFLSVRNFTMNTNTIGIGLQPCIPKAFHYVSQYVLNPNKIYFVQPFNKILQKYGSLLFVWVGSGIEVMPVCWALDLLN